MVYLLCVPQIHCPEVNLHTIVDRVKDEEEVPKAQLSSDELVLKEITGPHAVEHFRDAFLWFVLDHVEDTKPFVVLQPHEDVVKEYSPYS